MNTFLIYMENKRKFFDNYAQSFFSFSFSYGKKLVEAMKYSFFSGGKRIRPILLYLFFESFTDLKYSFEDEKFLSYIFPPSFAIETIHTYSLIHDDLPSMDNDDYRRGKPTCHKIFGEATAILAGDALLNYAYEVLIDWESDFVKDFQEIKSKVLKTISKASGAHGLVIGQEADIELENFEDENLESQLNFIIENKTVKLLRASILSGFILSKNKNIDIKLIYNLGTYIGFIFQLIDDILDYEKEKKENKKTFATLFGIEKTKSLAKEYKKKAYFILDDLESKGYKLKIIKDFVDFLYHRKT